MEVDTLQSSDVGSGIARILLLSSFPDHVQDVRRVLDDVGHECHWGPLDTPVAEALDTDQWDLLVVDGSRRQRESLGVCRAWREEFDGGFLPIIFLK